MKAEFDGQDYMLFLEKGSNELLRLENEKFEAPLKQAWEPENDLGKLVTIELAENGAMDGIELKYFPEDAGSFDEIKNIQVKLNRGAYKQVVKYGQFGTRYNCSDKVEIINGYSEEL
ncbi:MAG: hypothetical protein KJ623_03700 [Nanoarchaeota archaeon]|nr:hypothetical protein [Nanoarchaeota archaeon]MBU0962370.1 hypothetical protein [Nanoarchaeota archaeon]